MIERLRTPIKTSHLMVAACALTAGVAVYCLIYTALAGSGEKTAEAAAWAAANVLPWLFAFELGKRRGRVEGKLLVLAAATAVSLALGALTGGGGELGFELVRRLPAILLVLLLFAAVSLPTRKERAASPSDPADLPLAPETIDWIGAAGNYVELHGCGRVVLHRAPLSVVEAQLAPRGFVRVHRSTLVRRDRIMRVRPVDVVLRDGTLLKTGSRYRAALGPGKFVPSSHEAGKAGTAAP